MVSTERKRFYWVHAEMKQRCCNPNNKHYCDYGARGITVCPQWLSSFECFVRDMGPRFPGQSLERIDNGKGYSPENCIWADRMTQNSNRRTCVYVFVDGERVTVKRAASILGINYRAAMKRIRDRGWDIERALSEPLHKGNATLLMHAEVEERIATIKARLRRA